MMVMSAVVIAVSKIRIYALRVQDRVIHLEERLTGRTDASLRPGIAEFRERQLIGLRFAGLSGQGA